MKIRHKISLISISGIFLIALFSIILLRTLFMNYVEKSEDILVNQDIHRAISIIQREESSLEGSVMDWAYWDDTYHFLNGTYSDYVDVNLQDNTLTSLGLNYMGFFDLSGNNIYAQVVQMDAEEENSFKKELVESFQQGVNYTSFLSSPTPTTGLLIVCGKPFLISMSPVTTSNLKSPSNGVIIFCKLIDQTLLDYFKEVLTVDIKFDTAQAPELLDVEDSPGVTIDSTILSINKTQDSVKSYTLVNNVFNSSNLLLVLETKRPHYRNGLSIFNYSSIVFIGTFIAIASLCLLVLEFSLFRRIEKLDRFMNSVRTQKDMSEMISLTGNDEVTNLAASANNMLKEMDNYYNEIRTNEERFNLIMEATNDGYFDTDLLTKKLYINPDWLDYLGYTDHDGHLDYNQTLEIMHPEDRDLFQTALNDCLSGSAEKLMVEFRAQHKSGEWLWLHGRGKVVEYDEQRKPRRLIGSLSDITRRKNYEEENLYLSQTDLVTTLKNRNFIEILLEKADDCILCSSWIILGDVNGLKLINDAFGHQEGDRLLHAIGTILKKCCSPADVPARWGGDEFIIFIKDNDANYVDNLIRTIQKECGNMRDYQTPISISWGRANKDSLHPEMKSVIKLAEERMYRNKLLESRSAKSSILSSLEQSLHEKHIETEEHTRRIAQMCVQIGKRMGLTQEELDEVTLLSLLHDIGKIGIPEAILLKPGKLTTDEWEVMKTHSEIGYRIAMSTPELAHVANEILSHHERYDGTGYPQGLKCEEIPKLSRLLTIVDSYDVMIHSRQYKEAMSIEHAIQEIQDCSGKQFDPKMVEQFLTILSEDDLFSA